VLLDEGDDQDAYRIFEDKSADGSLEIKLTETQEHGKLYIVHNKPEFSQNGDYLGTVFTGSVMPNRNGQDSLPLTTRPQSLVRTALENPHMRKLQREHVTLSLNRI